MMTCHRSQITEARVPRCTFCIEVAHSTISTRRGDKDEGLPPFGYRLTTSCARRDITPKRLRDFFPGIWNYRPLADPSTAWTCRFCLLVANCFDVIVGDLAKIGGFGVFLTATTVFGVRRPRHPPRHAASFEAQDHVHPRTTTLPFRSVRGWQHAHEPG